MVSDGHCCNPPSRPYQLEDDLLHKLTEGELLFLALCVVEILHQLRDHLRVCVRLKDKAFLLLTYGRGRGERGRGERESGGEG